MAHYSNAPTEYDPALDVTVSDCIRSASAAQIVFGKFPPSTRVEPVDRIWFADNPARRYRVRAPLPTELRRCADAGALTPLGPGQSYAVFVMCHPDGPISTAMFKVRLGPDGFPDTDEEIVGAIAEIARRRMAIAEPAVRELLFPATA